MVLDGVVLSDLGAVRFKSELEVGHCDTKQEAFQFHYTFL